MSLEAWEGLYWYACDTILAHMKSDLDAWLGASDSSAPKAILQASKSARQQSVQLRVERHREQFSSRKKADRETALHDAEQKEHFHYKNLFFGYPDAEWPLRCPACGGKAFLAGVQVGEEVIDTQPDEYAMWETVEKEL